MNKEQITEALKMYRSYKTGISGYERPYVPDYNANRYETAAACRVTLYSDMPMGTGSGSRAPTLTGGWSLEDHIEYMRFKDIVSWIDLALEALTADERHIITKKWMDGLTLKQISMVTQYSERTVKTIHGRGLDKMYTCLRFIEPVKMAQTVA